MDFFFFVNSASGNRLLRYRTEMAECRCRSPLLISISLIVHGCTRYVLKDRFWKSSQEVKSRNIGKVALCRRPRKGRGRRKSTTSSIISRQQQQQRPHSVQSAAHSGTATDALQLHRYCTCSLQQRLHSVQSAALSGTATDDLQLHKYLLPFITSISTPTPCIAQPSPAKLRMLFSYTAGTYIRSFISSGVVPSPYSVLI
jgi:hypothetical protein